MTPPSTNEAAQAGHAADQNEISTFLSVENLEVGFPSEAGVVLAANRVSFSMHSGEVLGLVGESGSGKSVTCRALVGLVPRPGSILGGRILYRGRDLTRSSRRHLRSVRASEISMIFQDPMSSLNPVFTIGHELIESVERCEGLDRSSARRRSIELLERAGLSAAEHRMSSYPHELSGGQRQRVMIALALSGNPALLLADEPTTALDVTIQDQILRLLLELRAEIGMAMILVSHDMGVIAQTCDSVAVMYSGHLVEHGPVGEIFHDPRHPYTRALIDAVPRLAAVQGTGPLPTIPGHQPDLARLPPGCPFAPRCPHARAECSTVDMSLVEIGAAHRTACPFMVRT